MRNGILPASVRNVTVDRIGNMVCVKIKEGIANGTNHLMLVTRQHVSHRNFQSHTPQWCHVVDIGGNRKKQENISIS